MKVKSESEVAQLCPTLATPWTAAHQAPPTMGFSRQKYWSGVPLPSSTPTAVKVAGIVPWIHHTRVKRTYHADPKKAEWTAQRDPADSQETKTILKKKEKKILDKPLQDEAS